MSAAPTSRRTLRDRLRLRLPAAPAVAALAALGSLATTGLHAEVFKCAGSGNVPIYQDTPCPAGRELRNFQTNPPEITVLPAPELPAESRPASDPRRGAKDAAASKAPPAGDARLPGDAAERRFVRRGMTEGEVIARLGQPEVTSRGSKNKGSRWTYLPAARDPETITIIHFANGVVTEVERKVSKR
jgi:hypothetical protein